MPKYYWRFIVMIIFKMISVRLCAVMCVDYELVNASVFTWLNVWQEKGDNETLKATLVKLVKK